MIYASLVPGMPPPKSSDGRTHTLESLINENVDGIITSLPIQDRDKKNRNIRNTNLCLFNLIIQFQKIFYLAKPIVAQAYGEKNEEPRDMIRIFVTAILENMVGHACSIRWKDSELEKRGFPFMWDMWKEYYVSALFTDLNLNTDLYNPILQLNLQSPMPYDFVKYIDDTGSVDSSISTREDLLPARIAFIQWLIEYSIDTLEEKKPQTRNSKMDKISEDEENLRDPNNESGTPDVSDRQRKRVDFKIF